MKEVLGDLIIQNDREIPPPGFRLVEKTIDTCKSLCLLPRILLVTTAMVNKDEMWHTIFGNSESNDELILKSVHENRLLR